MWADVDDCTGPSIADSNVKALLQRDLSTRVEESERGNFEHRRSEFVAFWDVF